MPHRRHIGRWRCWRRQRRINAWLDLTESQRQTVQRQAHRCAACSAELEQMLALQHQLSAAQQAYQTLQYPHALPPAQSRVAWTQRQNRRAWPNWLLVPSGIAAGLATVALVLLVSQYMLPSLTPRMATPSVRYRALPPRPASPQPASVAATLQVMRQRIRQGGDVVRPQKPSGLALRMPKRPRRLQMRTPDRTSDAPLCHEAAPA